MERAVFSIGTDVVLVNKSGESYSVLLIKRGHEPFKGRWALPGGFLEKGEDPMEGAARELAEETHVTGVPLAQVGAFGRPDRDPRGHVISIAYCAVLPDDKKSSVQADDDATDARWFDLAALPPLAFDHDEIIARARTV
ncbi:NUDIX hydrolase, partial [Desulfovibrio sp. OttesenSCG-928-I05]|nr:NUDIX hydrolase [Desulfovibrio sp. OttesenSCG-928-I05]